MLRADRGLTERLFSDGLLKVVLVHFFSSIVTFSICGYNFTQPCYQVLVCTATLAWGVNLPAHTVVIKVGANYCASHLCISVNSLLNQFFVR